MFKSLTYICSLIFDVKRLIVLCKKILISFEITGIDVEHPAIEVTPVPIHNTSQGSKDIEFCKCVPVHGVS
uniref:Transmembrane protein 194 n=1 Tax=Tanacetum cinerariifolium TaxID=118510 RepID=A0A699KRL9_TANCI|nr:transmembrane protein 194 [Tanacetum cinerariifolium]